MHEPRFCLWSHPSRGHHSSVGLVVRPQRWAGTSYSASPPRLLARGPLSSAPGRLGNTGSFPQVGGTRLLRSGGPCIRLTQLAFPVSPDPPWPALGQHREQVTPNLWVPDALHIRSADRTPTRPRGWGRQNVLPGNCQVIVCSPATLAARHQLAVSPVVVAARPPIRAGLSSCFGYWVEVPTASSFAGPRLEPGESPNSEPHCGAQAQTPRTMSYGADRMLRPVVGVYSLRLRASAPAGLVGNTKVHEAIHV